MADEITTYLVVDGDRWDTVADKNYGDPLKTRPIIRANPNVALNSFLVPGARLTVPILESPPAENDILPPWMKAE